MRTFLSLVGLVVFGLVLFLLIGNVAVDRAWLAARGGWAWLAAIGLIVADIAIPIPTTVVITSLGQMYGPLAGGAIGTLGTFAAGMVAYAIARLAGRRFAEWLLRDELDKAARFFATSGAFAVACSRWLPLLPEAISFLAGLVRMPVGKYSLALLSSAVPMSFAYSALATVSTNEFVPLLISMVLPVPIWWLAARLLHLRASAAELRDDEPTG